MVLEQVTLGCRAPEAVVGLDDVGKAGIALILVRPGAQLVESDQGHRDVGVDELLAAGDAGEVAGGLGRCVEAADVGDHNGRVNAAGSGELQGLDHVCRVATGGAHNVGRVVVNVVEVDRCHEGGVGRAGEEVQAAVTAEDQAGLLDDRGDRRVAQHVVEALATGDGAQLGHGVLHVARVHEVELDARLLLDLCGREEALGAVKAVLVDVGHDEQARLAVTVQRIGEGAQAHRARTGGDGEVATLDDAHLMGVDTHLGVVGGVQGANGAGQGLGERGLIICLALVDQEAVGGEDLLGKDAIGGVSAAELIGVARGVHGARVVDSGLDGELLSGVIEVGVRGTHLDRVCGCILVDALVVGAQLRHLIGGHADRVGDDLDEHLVVLDGGQLELLEPQIHRRVKPDAFCLHVASFLFHVTLTLTALRVVVVSTL